MDLTDLKAYAQLDERYELAEVGGPTCACFNMALKLLWRGAHFSDIVRPMITVSFAPFFLACSAHIESQCSLRAFWPWKRPC
jgi:hypothetical protein